MRHANRAGACSRDGRRLAMTSRMRVIALLLPIVVGCGPPPADVLTPLTQLHAFHIYVTETGYDFWLDFSQPGNAGTASGWCPVPCPVALSDLSAQLDGLAAQVLTHGGKVGEDPGDDVPGDNICAPPKLSVATPPLDHESHLHMSDRSGTVDCDVPELKETVSVALVPPGPWELKAGQAVTAQFSPGGRSAGPVELATFDSAGEIAGQTVIDGAVFKDDLVTFTLPTVVAPGAYVLEFGTPVGARQLTCVPALAYADLETDASASGFKQQIKQQIMIVP